MAKKRYLSRQVRRATERRSGKRRNNQGGLETQESEKSKRKFDWKFVVDIGTRFISLLSKLFTFFE